MPRRNKSKNSGTSKRSTTSTFKPDHQQNKKTMSETLSAGTIMGGRTPIRRIRTPHRNDVLSGRGGGINSHPGNIQFRGWVAPRRGKYNLAPYKQDKHLVAKEVIDLVQAQSPPGRFLQKDPTGVTTWWVEVDESRSIAKTCQALREGAPQIRGATKHSSPSFVPPSQQRKRRRTDVHVSPTTESNGVGVTPNQVHVFPSSVPATSSSSTGGVRPLMSNHDFKYGATARKAAVVSPLLAPMIAPDSSFLEALDLPALEPLLQTNTTLPAMDWETGPAVEFVNPFLNEEAFLADFFPSTTKISPSVDEEPLSLEDPSSTQPQNQEENVAAPATMFPSHMSFVDLEEDVTIPEATADLYREHNEQLFRLDNDDSLTASPSSIDASPSSLSLSSAAFESPALRQDDDDDDDINYFLKDVLKGGSNRFPAAPRNSLSSYRLSSFGSINTIPDTPPSMMLLGQ